MAGYAKTPDCKYPKCKLHRFDSELLPRLYCRMFSVILLNNWTPTELVELWGVKNGMG